MTINRNIVLIRNKTKIIRKTQVNLYLEKYFKIKTLFYVYIGIIILLVILPINGKNAELNHVYLFRVRGDYFLHMLMYAPWAFWGIKMSKKTFNWFMTGILFATGSEGIQYFLPYRSFNINDIISNNLGVFLGFIVGGILLWIKRFNY